MPLFGRKGIVSSRGPLTDVTREARSQKGGLLGVENTEHVTNKGTDFVSLAFGSLCVGILQSGDHVHYHVQSLREELLLFLELVDQRGDVIDRTFPFGTFTSLEKDSIRLLVRQENLTSGGRGSNLE